jgi:hypothetical protein
METAPPPFPSVRRRVAQPIKDVETEESIEPEEIEK